MPGITQNWATKTSDKVVRRDGSNPPAGHFCAVNLALTTAIREESPAGGLNASHSGSNPASRQHGKFLLRLGQAEGFRSELAPGEKPQAHRLVGVRPRWTQGSHHFDSAIHKFFEIEPPGTGGFSAK